MRFAAESLGTLLLLAALGCASTTTGEAPSGGDPVEYRPAAHPVTGVELPRIRLPERPEIERKVNARLDALAGELRCDEDVDVSWYHVGYEVGYAAHDVFSLEVGSSFYCGGAHPVNDADRSLTFDLVAGEPVDFRDLFASYERDEGQIVGAYVRHLAPEDLESCADVLAVDELLGHSFVYTLSEEGLRMRTSFPHVIEACNATSVVPFGELRSVARPGGLLERLIRIQGG